MAAALKVLVVEDSPRDAELAVAELHAAGFTFEWKRVETEPDFLNELDNLPDIILADYSLPQFNGLRAVQLLKARALDIPLILISGTMGEDAVVEAMKHGATDCLFKDRISRLGSAIQRALDEKQLRHERQRAEAAFSENEKKFSTMFQSSPIAMALSTADEGRYLDVNKEFLRMLQRTREEVVGHTSLELGVWIRSEDRAVYLAMLKEHGSVRNVEMDIHGRSGLVTRILWSAETVIVGGRSCLLGSLLDITERQRAEEALRESENKFRKIFENVQDVFYQTNREGKILEISPSIVRYSGYSREELIGQPVEDIYYNREDRVNLLKILQEKGEVVDYETRLKTKDGRLVYTSVNAHILMDAAGSPVGVEGALRDVTARKQAQDDLRQKTAFLEAQVDSALDGILVVDQQGNQILQNQRMDELWKFPQSILDARDQKQKMQFATSRTKDPAGFAAKVQYLYQHPDEVSRDEIELVDGTMLDRYSSPVRDKDGKYYGRIWAFRDITGQRRLELQLRQSQKMEAIGQLAGGVAHDFNNILAVIQLQAGMLKLQQSLTPQQLEFAREIEKATARAASLTRQLLLFSQQQPTRKRNLNLNETVANIVKMLQLIGGEAVRMQFKLSPGPLLIHADAGMIDQVLLNLTINARDAMPQGGQLVIETAEVKFDEPAVDQSTPARPGTFACLSVSDTGCGIPPENLPRIFEPFFTTKEVGKGTGLGLATIFGIVQQHQGWINVYSEVGLGTTMRIYLPRLAEPAASEMAGSLLETLPGGTETILVVEDDPAVRLSMQCVLSHLGYRVLEAANGVDAFEIWQQHRADIRLLVTDLVMPGGINGKELAARLVEQEAGLKVIYVSGYSATVAGKDFRLEEGVNFLTKPFETHKLAQIVRKCLDRK